MPSRSSASAGSNSRRMRRTKGRGGHWRPCRPSSRASTASTWSSAAASGATRRGTRSSTTTGPRFEPRSNSGCRRSATWCRTPGMDAPRTLHSVREDAYNYVWDNSIEPALEIEPGEAVELRVRDASDEQITSSSGADDVAKLDFDHVNPVSGPVFVKGARPGDVLEVELLELRPRDGWGWTALIPGFGLLADEFPEPWLRISRVEAERARV